MKNVDLIFSVAGARGDFVDAWLSTLYDYNSKTWIMDELTGKTVVFPTLRRIDNHRNINLIDDLENIFQEKLLDEDKIFSSGMHATNLVRQFPKSILLDKNYNFRFILITFEDKSIPKIHWEVTVKNYLPQSDKKIKVRPGVSVESMFLEKLNKENANFLKITHKNIENQLKFLNVTIIQIEYEEIIKPSGSYYLQEKLNLNVTEKDHKYWEEQLKKSHSPLKVECFGKVFKYEDLV